ncbi:DUF5133 domain-containing protein [Streptomyces griseoviridis]|uniref:DUF5133 domain-containing protein n=2 Tax=Streptomyces TaxID=1883 RepID=A0A3S9ZNI6_STRGD|nr:MULTISPECIES: DUF5133 domain-containing protein [Streptomyces]AZS89249.1 DUF5133 domain-containing protein [Streptomyces griseoviridis]MDH6699500.1 hypothetical protein [Streptomyces sp. MAA16]MDT0475817.1 DUF5133 domain-containing protein [Streptomyces sp. DSM 41014]QCN83908.1 DUF5133 domain-containing protein [Streptomyces griseoviridis]
MLLPAPAEVARHLRRYRAWERLMLASPTDPAVRSAFEDAGYSLCVLMGERCAREAADAAERYRHGSAGKGAPPRAERTGLPRTALSTRHGSPTAPGHAPAGAPSGPTQQ